MLNRRSTLLMNKATNILYSSSSSKCHEKTKSNSEFIEVEPVQNPNMLFLCATELHYCP